MYDKKITLPSRVDWLQQYQEFAVDSAHMMNRMLSVFGIPRQKLINQFSQRQEKFVKDCEQDIRTLVRALCEQERATGQILLSLGHPLKLTDKHTAKDVAVLQDTIEFSNGMRVSAIGVEEDDRRPVILIDEQTEGEPSDFTAKSFCLDGGLPYPTEIALVYEALWDSIEEVHLVG